MGMQCELSAGDRDSLEILKKLRARLLSSDGSDHIILHCSACLHRTGICFYVLLRLLGDSSDAALAKMLTSRPKTRADFDNLGFQPWAEWCLEELEPGLAVPELLEVARRGRAALGIKDAPV